MLQIFYIKNLQASSSLDPSGFTPNGAFTLVPSFQLRRAMMRITFFVPLDFMIELSGYGSKRTSLEVKPTDSLC